MTIQFVPLAIVAAVGLAILIGMILAKRRAPEERLQRPLYERRCAVQRRRGVLVSGANIPLHRVALYDDFMAVAGMHPHVLKYEELELERSDASLGSEVTIVDSDGVRIRIQCFDKGELARLLAERF